MLINFIDLSKDHLLVSLIFFIVFLLSIALISALTFIIDNLYQNRESVIGWVYNNDYYGFLEKWSPYHAILLVFIPDNVIDLKLALSKY
jgi:hypothetical protein